MVAFIFTRRDALPLVFFLKKRETDKGEKMTSYMWYMIHGVIYDIIPSPCETLSKFRRTPTYLRSKSIYWKRDSKTSVFLWICEIVKNTFFYGTPLVAASLVPNQNLLMEIETKKYWWIHSISERLQGFFFSFLFLN